MKIRLYESMIVVSLVVCLFGSIGAVSCSTGGANSDKVDVVGIDPNAPALPPDAGSAAANASEANSNAESPAATENSAAVTSESTVPPPPAAPSTIKEETTTPNSAPSPAASVETVPATPKVEDLTAQDKGASIGTLDDEVSEVNAVPAAIPHRKRHASQVKESSHVFGSGKQKRYIKADQLHIRTQPDRYSKSIGIIYGGDEVHVTIRGDWAKLEEGQWIRSRWLVKVRPRKFQNTSGTNGGSDDESKSTVPHKIKKRKRHAKQKKSKH